MYKQVNMRHRFLKYEAKSLKEASGPTFPQLTDTVNI